MSQALYWIDGKWQSLEVDNADNLDGKDSLDFSFAGHKHFKTEITDLPGNVTTSQDGFMSVADKVKLNNIAENANNYSHPTSSGNKHIPSGGSSGQILRWSSDGTATWGADNNTTYGIVTTSANGLMSSTDKSKLDTIAINANNYSHPSTHPASMVTQDANNRFVTDTEKSTWNAKANASHTHTIAQVTGLETRIASLEEKATSGATQTYDLSKNRKIHAYFLDMYESKATLNGSSISTSYDSASGYYYLVNITGKGKINTIFNVFFKGVSTHTSAPINFDIIIDGVKVYTYSGDAGYDAGTGINITNTIDALLNSSVFESSLVVKVKKVSYLQSYFSLTYTL